MSIVCINVKLAIYVMFTIFLKISWNLNICKVQFSPFPLSMLIHAMLARAPPFNPKLRQEVSMVSFKLLVWVGFLFCFVSLFLFYIWKQDM